MECLPDELLVDIESFLTVNDVASLYCAQNKRGPAQMALSVGLRLPSKLQTIV